MKKTVMLLCVAAICFLFIGIQNSYAGLKEARPDPAIEPAAAPKIGLPDLTVSIRFVRIINYISDGNQCYSVRPGFTITNVGQSDANNFDWMLYGHDGGTWQHYSSQGGYSLKPGQSMTIDHDSPTHDLPWCTYVTGWQPGWRVVVDTNNTVAESNENNNVAEKMFEIRMIDKPDIPKPPQPMIKPNIPKATQKEIQPAPMPKSSPVKILPGTEKRFDPQPEPPGRPK